MRLLSPMTHDRQTSGQGGASLGMVENELRLFVKLHKCGKLKIDAKISHLRTQALRIRPELKFLFNRVGGLCELATL